MFTRLTVLNFTGKKLTLWFKIVVGYPPPPDVHLLSTRPHLRDRCSQAFPVFHCSSTSMSYTERKPNGGGLGTKLPLQRGVNFHKCVKLLNWHPIWGLFHLVIIFSTGRDKASLGKAVHNQGCLTFTIYIVSSKVIDLATLLTVTSQLESMCITILDTFFPL